jgi:hypothetical protein
MSHPVDGFDLRFAGRRSWKAERRKHGRLVDLIPVAWTKGRRAEANEIFQELWYQNPAEIVSRAADHTPFAIALAVAKDYNTLPHAFREFVGVFEVVPTGRKLSDNSIETRVLRRARATKDS